MHSKNRKMQWVLVLTAALLMALFAATTGFAEGEEPPVAPLAEEPVPPPSVDVLPEEPAPEPDVTPPAEEAAAPDLPAEEAVPEAETTPLAEEAAPAEDIVPAAEPLPAEEILPEPAVEAGAAVGAEEIALEPLAELAAEAVESGVALVDESGGELPLTETNSAELLGSGDPYYTVGLTKYSFFADPGACGVTPNCQDNLGSDVIQDALNYMDTTGLPSNRMLYVQGGTYDGFTVNGSSSPWLTLLNGVIGEDGSESTYIIGDIYVTNNTGGFSLSGFTLNTGGRIIFNDNSGMLKLSDIVVSSSTADPYALTVSNHAGAVVLDGVNVSNSSNYGTYIDTSIGSYPITIKNSAFNENGWADPSTGNIGLVVWSNNTITIDGVSASGNNGEGIDIWDYATLNLKNTFMVGNNCLQDYYGHALYSFTDGTGFANLENVYAYGNDYGLYLEGGSLNAKYIEVGESAEDHGLYFYSTVGSSRVEYSQFHGNLLDGLHIENKGSIYLNSIQSNDNLLGAGAYLDNYKGSEDGFLGSGMVTITSPTSGGGQLANRFISNGDSGVTIHSRGSVLISNADMGENNSIGLDVNNYYGIGSVTLNVTISSWQNGFFNNDLEGISIDSQGAVSISRTSSEWNGSTGIVVVTKGTIELVNVNSANNSSYGANLYNSDALLPRNVTLTNSSFDHNNGYGLLVQSKGSIIAYGLSASGNSVRNQFLGSATSQITYHDLLGDTWVEDSYTFEGAINDVVNLYLNSDDFDAYLELYDPNGQLIASNDDWDGLNSKITWTLTANGIYTVVAQSLSNNGSGEYWFSLNDLAHDYVYAYNNYIGAYLNNKFGNGAVTIYKPTDVNQLWGNFFDLNTSNGLRVDSNGTISIDSAAATDNFDTGVYLDNPTSPASVTVSNSRTDGFYSYFSGNGGDGVYIETRGNVTLKNIGAWHNDSNGVFVDNCQFDFASDTCLGFGSVKVLALGERSNDFGGNAGDGLDITSKGAILLTNITAENNGNSGVDANNNYSGSSGSMTVTTSGTNGWNRFTENAFHGLVATSNGGIVLTKVDAYGNGHDGVYLDNDGSSTSASMLITSGYFYSNDLYGLQAYSKGAIIWKYGSAWDNGSAGAMLYNTNGFAGISILGTSAERMTFAENGWSVSADNGGLLAYSNGKIILGYASTESNNGNGFLLDNSTSTTNQMVDVTEVETRWSNLSGLNVLSMGAITIKGIRSEENNQHGAYLINDYTGALGNVTVTTTTAWTANNLGLNGYSGLTIESRGSVSLKNIDASENGWDGVSVDNSEGTGSVSFLTTGRQFRLNNNEGSGLYIVTNGSVVLNNPYGLNAHNNGGDAGVYINNYSGLPTSTVSLTRVFANDNYNGNGIVAFAKGKVTAVSTTVQNNNSGGLYIISSTGGVTLSGSNYFTDNGGSGLTIQAPGAISISNVRAWNNGNEGIYVYGFSANITLNNIISAHNQASGLFLNSNGNYYLNKVTSFMNGQSDWGDQDDDGLAIITSSSASTITILNSTFMNNWNGSGIEIVHPLAVYPRTPTSFWPTLVNTSYLSNGETNIYVHMTPP